MQLRLCWPGEPGELKHLSTPRKRNQLYEIPQVVASERGRAQTADPIMVGRPMDPAGLWVWQGGGGRCLGSCANVDRTVLERPVREGENPVGKRACAAAATTRVPRDT